MENSSWADLTALCIAGCFPSWLQLLTSCKVRTVSHNYKTMACWPGAYALMKIDRIAKREVHPKHARACVKVRWRFRGCIFTDVSVHLSAGEELAYSYGLAYWETFADQVLDIEYSEKQQEEIRRQQHEIGVLETRIMQLEVKLRKKRSAVKPLTNGKRTPSSTLVPTSLSKPLTREEEVNCSQQINTYTLSSKGFLCHAYICERRSNSRDRL